MAPDADAKTHTEKTHAHMSGEGAAAAAACAVLDNAGLRAAIRDFLEKHQIPEGISFEALHAMIKHDTPFCEAAGQLFDAIRRSAEAEAQRSSAELGCGRADLAAEAQCSTSVVAGDVPARCVLYPIII